MEAVKFGDNRYCVPSVISSFVGITTDEAVVAIQKVLNTNKPIKAVPISKIPACFNEFGYSCIKIPHFGTSVFSALLSLKDGMYLLNVGSRNQPTTHAIGIEIKDGKRYVCDNRSQIPINGSVSARLSQNLLDVFRVEKK